jgi:hypothetical protein
LESHESFELEGLPGAGQGKRSAFEGVRTPINIGVGERGAQITDTDYINSNITRITGERT